MKKYDVNRICFKERNDGYYNNVISFHKDYNPFFGKSRTIDYDFGQSPLRDRINAGISREKSYKYKIIDSVLVYSQNSSPAFGE